MAMHLPVQLMLMLSSLSASALTSSIPASTPYSDRVDFYQGDPNIVHLDNSTFYEALLDKPHAWAIEFYRDWCGHCRRFAPVWTEVANQTSGWGRLVRVGALNCARRRNTAICRKYAIWGVPHVRLFEPNAGRLDLGVSQIEHYPDLQVSAIATFLERLQARKQPQGWPDLGPFNGTIDDLFKNPEPIQALVLDSQSRPIGQLVKLDLSGQQQMVRVSRSFEAPQGLQDTSGERPLLLVFKGGPRQIFTANRGTNARKKFVSALRDMMGMGIPERAPFRGIDTGATQLTGSSLPAPPPPSYRSDVVYMVDMENALVTALHTEVVVQSEISGERMSELRTFLRMLVDHWPGRRVIVRTLQQLLQFLQSKESVTGHEVELQLQKLQLPKLQPYRGCRGSKPGYRGYSCGLWTLFHAVTVQAVKNEPASAPYSILPAIHGYVKYFFSCRHCSQHFQQMAAEDGLFDVTNSRDAVLWLWRAHNKVNARLAGDLTEDPRHPKIQFPSASSCPFCVGASNTFNIPSTFLFLNTFYGRENMLLDGIHPLNVTSRAPEPAHRLVSPSVASHPVPSHPVASHPAVSSATPASKQQGPDTSTRLMRRRVVDAMYPTAHVESFADILSPQQRRGERESADQSRAVQGPRALQTSHQHPRQVESPYRRDPASSVRASQPRQQVYQHSSSRTSTQTENVSQTGTRSSTAIHGNYAVQGQVGMPGRQGQAGTTGRQGQAGMPGRQGQVGMPGRQGQTGLPGRQGQAGIPGRQGQAGTPGRQGQAGMSGRQRQAGMPGRQGQAGTSGRKGQEESPRRQVQAGMPARQGQAGILPQVQYDAHISHNQKSIVGVRSQQQSGGSGHRQSSPAGRRGPYVVYGPPVPVRGGNLHPLPPGYASPASTVQSSSTATGPPPDNIMRMLTQALNGAPPPGIRVISPVPLNTSYGKLYPIPAGIGGGRVQHPGVVPPGTTTSDTWSMYWFQIPRSQVQSQAENGQ